MDVEQHEGRTKEQRVARIAEAAGLDDAVAPLDERERQRLPQQRVVVDDESARGGGISANPKLDR